jgi:hypothetical protein
VDLPVAFVPRWQSRGAGVRASPQFLTELLSQFAAVLDRCQPFWQVGLRRLLEGCVPVMGLVLSSCGSTRYVGVLGLGACRYGLAPALSS